MFYRLLIYIPIIVLLVLIQSTTVRIFPNIHYQPDLITIAIVYLAHKEGKVAGQSTGFFSGILEDVLGLGPFGFHTLVRTVMGYTIGFTTNWRVTDSPLVALVLVVLGIVIQYFLYLLIGTVFSYPGIVISTFSLQSVWGALLTILFTPICFSFLSLLPFKRSSDKNMLERLKN